MYTVEFGPCLVTEIFNLILIMGFFLDTLTFAINT